MRKEEKSLYDHLNMLVKDIMFLGEGSGIDAYKTCLSILINPCKGMNQRCQFRRKIKILLEKPALLGNPITKIIKSGDKSRYQEFAGLLYDKVEYPGSYIEMTKLLKRYEFEKADHAYDKNKEFFDLFMKNKSYGELKDDYINKQNEERKEGIRKKKQNETAHEKLLTELKGLAKESLDIQIMEAGSIEELVNLYVDNHIDNDKVKQIFSLKNAEEAITQYREETEIECTYHLEEGELPEKKNKQYKNRIRNETNHDDVWNRKNIWFYTAAEWAVEDWAVKHKLKVIDYNKTNLYSPQDYNIDGKDVDIKTTIGIGRGELPTYCSASGNNESGEVIIGVRSHSRSLDAEESLHYIQGVLDESLYGDIKQPLNYFIIDKNIINPCYLHSLYAFYNVNKEFDFSDRKYSDDVIQYFLGERELLKPLLYLASKQPDNLHNALSKTLPACHHDFIPIAKELSAAQKLQLLPHYLADYIITKIINKEEIERDAIGNVIYSIYTPSHDQYIYIENLLTAYTALSKVRCKFHPEETIESMDIEYYKGGIPTLRARCSHDPKLSTTFFTYSWRTGETIIYGDEGVETCDSKDCGCLTHLHDDEKIGRKTCRKYGENGTHRFQWETGYKYLQGFVQQHRHANVPQAYKTDGGFNLGKWLYNQKINREELSNDEILFLDEQGVDWKI